LRADYVFDLDIEGYNVYDFLARQQIADAGEEQATAQMPHILEAYHRSCGIIAS
jgi:hypothetical protein